MPMRHARSVLAALRRNGADARLIRRFEAVVENRCDDPAACVRCDVRCLDDRIAQQPAPAADPGR